jgi:hypothetical protein
LREPNTNRQRERTHRPLVARWDSLWPSEDINDYTMIKPQAATPGTTTLSKKMNLYISEVTRMHYFIEIDCLRYKENIPVDHRSHL